METHSKWGRRRKIMGRLIQVPMNEEWMRDRQMDQ